VEQAREDSLARLEQARQDSLAQVESRQDSLRQARNRRIEAYNDSLKRIEKYFHWKDGRHIILTEYVKRNLHDPSTFQHVETRYEKLGPGTLKVWMRYRASNALGALVLNEITAKTDIDSGEVVEIISVN